MQDVHPVQIFVAIFAGVTFLGLVWNVSDQAKRCLIEIIERDVKSKSNSLNGSGSNMLPINNSISSGDSKVNLSGDKKVGITVEKLDSLDMSKPLLNNSDDASRKQDMIGQTVNLNQPISAINMSDSEIDNASDLNGDD